MLADPVDSDDEPVLLDADDDAGVVVVEVDDLIAEDDAALVDVPAWVCAAVTASTATAAVPMTPNDAVSLPRRRRARSRCSTVIRRLGDCITRAPGKVPVAEARHDVHAVSRGAAAARREDR